MLKYMSALLVGLTFMSCEKEDYFEGARHLIGDYDWVYSTTQSNEQIYGQYVLNYTTHEEVENDYGLRINDKNKLLFIKNQSKVESYKFNHPLQIGDLVPDSIAWYGKNSRSGSPLYYSGDTVRINNFPIYGTNYFIKQ
jgi:hypothetical protein